MIHALSRRAALLGLGGAVMLGRASLALAAAPTERRFVVVLLRGAMDGMSAVVPYGDPALASLRGALLAPEPGRDAGQMGATLDLGGFYGLHPALANMHAMYAAGDLAVLHAVAGSYRSRSHFEAQDYLESGADHRMTSGWLNRVIGALPRVSGADGQALAVGVSVPLLLRGPALVASWAPQSFTTPALDLYARIAQLNQTDKVTGPAIAAGLKERGFVGIALENGALPGGEKGGARFGFPALAGAAGKLMAEPNGPRIAALEIDGWDTHSAQVNRLTGPLKQLDAGLLALKSALGPAWRQTIVLVMTEFGRTARVNGTGGTDHGTGTAAFVAGGAVLGGRVIADWPGLGAGRLLDDRDLQPTTDLRAVVKGVLGPHLGVNATDLGGIFPDRSSVQPMEKLIRV